MRILQVLPPASSQMVWTQDELSRAVLRLPLGAPLHMAMRGDELLHGRCWQHCALVHGQRMSRRLELENGQRARDAQARTTKGLPPSRGSSKQPRTK